MFDTSQLMAASGGGGGGFYDYAIDGSLRFNDDDSAYLSRTPASAGNRKTWTWSGWVKRCTLNGSNVNRIITAYQNDDNFTDIRFANDDTINIRQKTGNVEKANYSTTAVYRDVSAWYHIVFEVDTTSGTAVKIYINGVQQSLTTTTAYPSNEDTFFNHTSSDNAIGAALENAGANRFLDGYMAEVNFIDGTALDATSFGEFKSGVWIPKAYSGSYGTNGFYLDFDGTYYNDKSGNGNNWTANNLAATDVVLDSPTNNFATLNPLKTTTSTFSEGNLKNYADSFTYVFGNFLMLSGKWYWEYLNVSGGNYHHPGIIWAETPNDYGEGNSRIIWRSDGNVYGNGTTLSTSYPSHGAGDIIGMAFDADTRLFTYYKNGTSVGSFTIDAESSGYISTDLRNAGLTSVHNFGQDSSFAGNKAAQGNTDANGYGDFYYAPPSGYLALCTANLPDPVASIDPAQDGSPQDHFNTVLYTGNGSTSGYAISGVGFAPEFTWIKDRTGTGSHLLCDVVRGSDSNGQIMLSSNQTTAESSFDTAYHGLYGGVNSLDSDGFTVYDGSHSAANLTNGSGYAYVAWNWKAGGSGVSNTDGSITSTVSANTDAGFSIVTYTGNGSSATVGHGLTKKPEFIINKGRANLATYNQWVVHHKDLTTDYILLLNATDAEGYAAGVYWQESNFSDTVFGVGPDIYGPNVSGTTYVNYCFHSVDGFSKFGSYTGNGSSDGPFCYTGFRPAFVMIKNASLAGADWQIRDNARDPYNNCDARLRPNLSNAEDTNSGCDFLSNGFKVTSPYGDWNGNGNTIIYMAFAENPFKYANAR